MQFTIFVSNTMATMIQQALLTGAALYTKVCQLLCAQRCRQSFKDVTDNRTADDVCKNTNDGKLAI